MLAWRVSMLLLLLGSVKQSLANPCTVYHPSGRSVLHDGSAARVAIAEEKLHFRLRIDSEAGDGTPGISLVETRVDYRFANSGPVVDAVIGFPIGLPEYEPDETDSLGFTVSGKGVVKRVTPTLKQAMSWSRRRGALGFCEESALPKRARSVARLERGPDPQRFTRARDYLLDRDSGVGLLWFFWRQRFAQRYSHVTVRYRLRPADPCSFSYVLRTARYWRTGRIGRLDVVVEQSDTARPLQPVSLALTPFPSLNEFRRRLRAGDPHGRKQRRRIVEPGRVDTERRRMTWGWRRMRPRSDLLLTLIGCRTPPGG
jgi:hypothetical protein